jgi:dihydroflavonol-4-reductase
MKICVTGADGMLGSNLIRALLRESYAVRALLHPSRNGETIAGLDIQVWKADLLQPEALAQGFDGCDAVIHTAAMTDVWPSQSEKLVSVNVRGTANVIDAALQAKAKKLIYVGTANSFGYGTKESPGDEGRPFNAGRYGLGYIDTKYLAYRLVLDAVREKGLPAVCVNPTFMIGPFDSKPGSGALILAVCRGQAPGCAPGGRNYISVEDVAAGIISALRKAPIGEAYILGHENLSYRELFAKIAKVVGRKTPSFVFPRFAVLAVGALGSVMGAVTHRAPPLSLPMARISCDGHYYRAAKAVEELGLPQTPIETAISAAYTWFRENGYLMEQGGNGGSRSGG